MNEREALEKIAKEIIVVHQQGTIGNTGYQIRNPKAIYNAILEVGQALAPQECDVIKCPYARICENKDKNGNIQVVCCLRTIDIRQPDKRIDMGCIMCKNNPTCMYKQLHSQQKTFTMEEIKEKIKSVSSYYGYNSKEFFYNTLLAEFEKAVD